MGRKNNQRTKQTKRKEVGVRSDGNKSKFCQLAVGTRLETGYKSGVETPTLQYNYAAVLILTHARDGGEKHR